MVAGCVVGEFLVDAFVTAEKNSVLSNAKYLG
jgi:hypothetical protein